MLEAFLTRSSYQTSLLEFHPMLPPVLLTTRVFLTFGQPKRASSTLDFSGTVLPPLSPSSAVITILQSASRILSLSDSGENPPKTTEWTAPILVPVSYTHLTLPTKRIV